MFLSCVYALYVCSLTTLPSHYGDHASDLVRDIGEYD